MTSVRIYDLQERGLVAELRDLLRLLSPQSLRAHWMISTVKSSIPGHEWFDATGGGGEKLEVLAHNNAKISGANLAALAEKTRQIVWGEFIGSLPLEPSHTWVIIRVADGTFYEIETNDEAVLHKIGSTYKDVRAGEAPITSWPLKTVDSWN